MDERVPRERYPWWVKFGLIGADSRRGQWLFVWLSVASAVACIVYGVVRESSLGLFVLVVGGVGFLVAAVMYWLTIRWIDRHGTWA